MKRDLLLKYEFVIAEVSSGSDESFFLLVDRKRYSVNSLTEAPIELIQTVKGLAIMLLEEDAKFKAGFHIGLSHSHDFIYSLS